MAFDFMKLLAGLSNVVASATSLAALSGFFCVASEPAATSETSSVTRLSPRPNGVNPSGEDYQRMLDQLHLQVPNSLPAPADDPNRPPNTQPVSGRSANWTDGVRGHTIVRSSWGHWSNYDEKKAGLYALPDPLRLKNGPEVTNATTWWKQRRPEILEDFQREVYGRIPTNTPKVTWEVTAVDTNAMDGTAIGKSLLGRLDNSAYPAISVNLGLTLFTPVKASKPVPVILVPGFGRTGFEPRAGSLGTTNGSSASASPAPTPAIQFGGPGRTFGGIAGANPRVIQLLLSNGWGYAVFNTWSVQADNGAGLTKGIIGFMNHGQPRKPDDWGMLAAWSWGLSRALDYLQTDPSVAANKVGLEGHSRWGKAALLAMALDQRFAIVYASCSGEGGAKLHRHDIGESLDNVAGIGEYHWMAGNFLKYAGHCNDLPVDAHELIALAAPRPVFITGGTQDLWSDPIGEFKACVGAGPVYRLLGKKDLGTTEMPQPDVELMSGDIAYREHAGGHIDAPDWQTFINFAKRYFDAGSDSPRSR
jgi:hypothetical protein